MNRFIIVIAVFATQTAYSEDAAIPKVVQIANPSEYSVLTPKMTEADFKKFLARAETGDPLAIDIVFYSLFLGFGTNCNFAESRRWLEKGYQKGSPLCLLYSARNLLGFRLDPRKRDEAKAKLLAVAAEPVFSKLAKDGNPAGMVFESFCRFMLGDDATGTQWILKAAELKYAIALESAATSYLYGLNQLPKDSEKSFQLLNDAAAQGFAVAQLTLGIRLSLGDGIAPNAVKGAEWIAKAAARDEPGAINELAVCYSHGRGVEKNDEKALELLRKSAELGFPRAMANLGIRYWQGVGVAQDNAKALQYLNQAAEWNDPVAENTLGQMYEWGYGTPVDLAKALEWYSKAADAGDNHARVNLGIMYMQGKGVAKDAKKGAALYLKAAQQGHSRGQFYYALCCLEGTGVEVNNIECMKWLRSSAALGEPGAQRNLQKWGIWRNPAPLGNLDELSKKAEADDGPSQLRLGDLYLNGVSVKQDDATAFKWYTRALKNGQVEANYCLGLCNELAIGTPVNTAQAIEFYRKATGNTDAANHLKWMGADGQPPVKPPMPPKGDF